ncbi:hypothetical protein GJ496_008391 [Pomphorhynchus laevis]|nr:hypothetical protein GJ496_008391 [Pomphorhynchus laevis]
MTSMAAEDEALRCLKSRYRSVCFQLNVNDDIAEQTWLDYVDLSERYTLEGDQLHWLSCILYLESRQCEIADEQKPSLNGLLQSSGLRPHRFFELCRRHLSGSDDIIKLELSYQVGIILAVKFPSVFEAVFDQNYEDFEIVHEFAWLLFCWARFQLFSNPSDLVNGFHLMLACHELLFQSALTAGLIDAIHPELESSSTVDVLLMLCDRFQVNSNEARSLLIYGLEPAIKELDEKGFLQLPLLDNIKENVLSLSRLYDISLSKADHLDERNIDEPCLEDVTTSTNPAKSILNRFLVNYTQAEEKLNSCLVSGNWKLKLDQTLRPMYGDMADYDDARKLTIVTLGQLLNSQELTNSSELEHLLFSTSLTGALFECCIRLIGYWQGRCDDVHWVGSTVPAFYAYSVIQPVIRALLNIGLCRDAARHLLAVEESMLECKIFNRDSPLWNRIANQTIPISTDVCKEDEDLDDRECYRRCHISNSGRGHSNADAVSSSAKKVRRIKHGGANKSTTKVNQNSLTLIMSKIYYLAAKRLDELCCEQLEQREIVARRCWFLIEYILQSDLTFLKDRHIDQIIMCVIYAMAKAVGQPLSFQKITKHYKKMGGKSQVCKIVLMNDNAVFSDIISFYNKVFVTKYKTVICNFIREKVTSGKDHDLPELPGRRYDRHLMDSPLKLSPRYSVYLSPRKQVCRSSTLFSYTYNTNPNKDFSKINTAMETNRLARKRAFPTAAAADEGSTEQTSEPSKNQQYEPCVSKRLRQSECRTDDDITQRVSEQGQRTRKRSADNQQDIESTSFQNPSIEMPTSITGSKRKRR